MPSPVRTTNADVIAAARVILEQSGPAGLTMQAVASRVGVRAPSLYKRFRDRDALLAAVASEAIDELAERFERANSHLRTLATTYRDFARTQPETFRLIFTAAAPQDMLERSSAPVLRATAAVAGEARALEAARLVTAWATGFLQMELAGAFRLGGDVDEAFAYGLDRIIGGIAADATRE